MKTAVADRPTVLVCGGRDYADRERLFRILDRFHQAKPFGRVVHGKCPTGADKFADEWAHSRGVPVEGREAKWTRYGKPAGPLRNRELVALYRPDIVVAFPGGSGTADMCSFAKACEIPVWYPLGRAQ